MKRIGTNRKEKTDKNNDKAGDQKIWQNEFFDWENFKRKKGPLSKSNRNENWREIN